MESRDLIQEADYSVARSTAEFILSLSNGLGMTGESMEEFAI